MKAFVIMPFDSEFDDVYALFIKPTCSSAGFDVFRADDLQNNRSIMSDIISSISTANLIIADLTAKNPNVYYELGIAHALDKPVLLLAQDLDEIPFDLQQYRILLYSTHFGKIEQAKESLKQLATSAARGELVAGNPVTDFRLIVAGNGIPVQKNTDKANLITPEFGEVSHGLLDYQLMVEEGFTEIANSIGGLQVQLTFITEAMDTATLGFTATPAPKSRAKVEIARQLASQFDKATPKISMLNKSYQVSINDIATGLTGLLDGQFQPEPDALEPLKILIQSISEIESAASGGRTSIATLVDMIDKTPAYEGQLARAQRRLSGELKMHIQNLDLTIAAVARAKMLGDALIARHSAD